MFKTLSLTVALTLSASGLALAQDAARPNILVIFGDDIGQTNLSAYSFGVMGYRTPNIDKIASEGMKFTDYYAEQSCTAGRSSFLTGQTPLRTGLSKVGVPGAPQGLQASNVTLASVLRDQGYATGQFGKNHLGDRDEFLPTAHGFDEFFGNLYHLNAEEEPEQRTWPKSEEFDRVFRPRGVIHSYADGRIEDTGPLTKKRMETVDEETADAAMDFMERAVEENKPFFTWYNTTRMHYRTHVRDENRSPAGLTSLTEYADGMVEHDAVVGEVIAKLEELGVADNTIVIYTTDNGPHKNTWPDAGTSPFRSEKNTNWEGAFRVPAMVRWPGHIAPGSISNEIFSGMDWLPTLAAAAGVPDIKEQLLAGATVDGKEYKNHLDGFNQLDHLTGKAEKSPRRGFIYHNDDGEIVAVRYENWKFVYSEQRADGTLEIWANPFTKLRAGKLFDLRADPYEVADITSNTYWDWAFSQMYLGNIGGVGVQRYLETFKDYPPAQRPGSFSIDQLVEDMQDTLQNVGMSAGQ